MATFREATRVEIAQMKAVHRRRDDFRSADERRYAHALGALAYAANPRLDALEALNVALLYEQLAQLPGDLTMATTATPKPPTLVVIPAGTKAVPCRGCKTVAVFFVGKQPIRVAPECVSRTTGNVYPTPDAILPTATTPGKGFNHFADCSAAGQFRR